MQQPQLSQDFLPIRQALRQFARLIARAQQGTPQVITRHGVPSAVVLAPAAYDALQQSSELGAEYLQALADAAQARADHGEAFSGEALLAWHAARTRQLYGRDLPSFDAATDPATYLDLTGSPDE